MIRTSACDEIVKKWEGYHKEIANGDCTAYPDVGSDDGRPFTIGFGTTQYRLFNKRLGRSDVRMGDVLTRTEAAMERDAELNYVEQRLFRELAQVPMTQAMFDALVSFVYNMGFGQRYANGETDGAYLQLERMKAKQYGEVASKFDLYVRGTNRKVLPGLITRRNEEEALFRSQGLPAKGGLDQDDQSPPPATNVPSKDEPAQGYKPCPVPLPWDRRLDRGNAGFDVYSLECALIGLKYLAKPKDGELLAGKFNEHVEYAVKVFQRQHNISDDGVVGEITRLALEQALKRARGIKTPSDGIPIRWEFRMKLIADSALRVGTLSFFDASGTVVRKETATSGLPNWQTKADFWERGKGPIPPGKYSIRFGDGYHLDTPGIEGHAFPMSPDPIYGSLPGQIRSEIMNHRDANVPGTAGCIGNLGGLAAYEQYVKWGRAIGRDLPGEVVYS